jgi:hypothetical protein
MGCAGFIVNKDALYVNWLGSALSLEECFWGHDRGVVCDLVDFTFSRGTSASLAARLVSKFKHMHPDASGTIPTEPVWYRTSDVESEVARQFPVFRCHFAWFCIPQIKKACENEGLEFQSHPSRKQGEQIRA